MLQDPATCQRADTTTRDDGATSTCRRCLCTCLTTAQSVVGVMAGCSIPPPLSSLCGLSTRLSLGPKVPNTCNCFLLSACLMPVPRRHPRRSTACCGLPRGATELWKGTAHFSAERLAPLSNLQKLTYAHREACFCRTRGRS